MNEQTNGPLTIIELVSENIKCLKAVRIRPNGSLVQITGPNEAGKSAVLESIEMALGGKGKIPPQPVRRGAATARIVLDLGEIKVERWWTPKGHTYVEVTGPSGEKFPEPQTILDQFYKEAMIDPLEFSRMNPVEQAETLRRVIGLDLSDIDSRKSAAYDKRTDVNRKVRDIEGLIAQVPPGIEAVPDKEIDVSALVGEIQAMNEVLRTNDAKRSEITNALNAVAQRNTTMKEATETLSKAQTEATNSASICATNKTELLDRHRLEIANLSETHARELNNHITRTDEVTAEYAEKCRSARQANTDAEAMLMDSEKRVEFAKTQVGDIKDPDVGAKKAQIEQADRTNTMVRAKQLWMERRGEHARLASESDELTKEITELAEQRQEMIAEAPMPVPGIGFDDAGLVTFNNLPFVQASKAVQIKIGAAIGFKVNPRYKSISIKDGSLIGEEIRAELAKMADDAGGQLWIERVAKRGERVGFTIEDGELVHDPAEQTTGATA